MKFKYGMVLTFFAFLIVLGGCKTKEAGSDNASKQVDTNDTSPVTFTFFNAEGAGKDIDTNKTKLGKMFEEETGVNFKMEHIVGDVNTKLGVMIASGDYPDVLVPGAPDKILEAEAFIPLNDLIDEYAPNLKKLYEPYLSQMTDEDGNIYFIPFGAEQGYLPNPNIDQGAFWIQRAVLKEFDYPKIKTLDQYFDLIEQYTEKYPKVDGKDTIGFTSLTDDWRFMAITNPPNHLAGYPNDGEVMVDKDTLEAKIYGNHEHTKRWLKKLNEMNSKGLFDKESFVSNYDEYLAKLTSGRVLGYFDYGWQAAQATNALRSAGDDDKEYMALPIVFDEDIKDQYIDPPAFVNNRGVGITVSAKDPVRIMKYFDLIAKEETQKLIMWGIEGETYEVDEDGRYYQTEEQLELTSNQEFREEFGFTYFEWNWPRGNGLFSDGNAWEPRRQTEVARANYSEGDKLLLDKYGVEVFADLFAEPDERPWYPAWSIELEQGTSAQIYTQRKMDLQRKHFPIMVMSSLKDFEGAWKDYTKEYSKLDVEEYEKTMTEEIKKKVESLN
ncbi:ABC transporter substrate-binding protein [Lederbergia lenta]|uniref:Polysaccharide ABC transporter substrate-binding protein n=1 Tax=Lederbergia lenta TaxID=1467 RepID=A0A2X4VSQ4_LEDLE|nr:ABC transporter substrate-binding protein [Lederbergia lenta]MCM3110918.1 ABC transporter substrate-binding protein [Lederbergia lenta]MEC2325686.1 ABC transporter substrate-binding protein [Lederbergia lenta]SQI53953.1 polysaccharide ABC transporter substrate-binding protein [Lederbergia lenta]